ncbi:gliding motility protein GldN [Nibribacter koreensis]|uniref:Uncharacterized protein n=1 Tax=Nibribacter koreensis TaxID=1084519 RepID=A0ABP8FTV1_9BACT
MKKLIVLGVAGLLSLPMVSVAQKRTTTTKKSTTTQAKSAAATAAQEKARQEELARQQQEAAASQRSQQLLAKSDSANPSARPIPPSDVMFKKTVWRLIDLREKQNKPMFSPGKEITKLIVEAVKRGELQPYATDSLNRPITAQEFLTAISPAQGGATVLTEEEKKAGFTADAAVADDGWGAPAKPATKGGKAAATPAPMTASNELFANQLYQLELKEDVIFDKKRSRLYHDIQAITITVPSKFDPLGIEKTAASFKFSDLHKVFKAHPDEALWFNQMNDAQHKNLADAFDLWLFSSYITKVSNVGNERLDEVYGSGKKGLLAAQQAMEELIEFEYSLWSY